MEAKQPTGKPSHRLGDDANGRSHPLSLSFGRSQEAQRPGRRNDRSTVPSRAPRGLGLPLLALSLRARGLLSVEAAAAQLTSTEPPLGCSHPSPAAPQHAPVLRCQRRHVPRRAAGHVPGAPKCPPMLRQLLTFAEVIIMCALTAGWAAGEAGSATGPLHVVAAPLPFRRGA